MSADALDRRKFARVAGMIGSSFDGEALAAARKAQEMLRTAGLSWESVLASDAADAEVERLRDELTRTQKLAQMERERAEREKARAERAATAVVAGVPDSDRDKLDFCLKWILPCTPWEKNFAQSLVSWRGRFTSKQKTQIDALYDKCKRIARARGQ